MHVGGAPAINNAFNDTITSDLAKADSIAIPLTMVLLVLVFGGLVAAGLPFVVAAGAVLGSFAVLFAVTLATDVSIFALNLVTGLGLGLGIDYALLVVNRFREQLAAGDDVESAVARTVTTAGRTVFVSGVTVAITLSSLSLFPQYFLRSFAYAGRRRHAARRGVRARGAARGARPARRAGQPVQGRARRPRPP